MRILVTLLIIIGSSFSMIAQEVNPNQNKQGDFFVYWGWNRSAYTNSDIRFYGDNYDFTIDNAVARDRQTPFSAYDYFNPTRITIPQFNARVGYFVTDRYSISIGSDHMKYVVDSDRKRHV